jgi:HSP20 family protein
MTTVPDQRSESEPGRWDPFRPFEDLYTQMGRLWGSAFGPGPGAGPTRTWAPCTDVSETQDGYLVEIEVPGVRQEDLDVKLTRDELTVRGELKETEREGLFHTRTRHTGQFEYRMNLPQYVKPDEITANLVNGVLTLHLPKAEAAGPRKIEISD